MLYNPVDLAHYASGRSLRRDLGLRDSDVVIGTVAQLRHGKGIDVLLDAARRLLPRHPELVFLVAGRAGNGEEAYARDMRAAAEAPELAGRVRFLGSRTDIPNLLATFDAFVLPTRTETFGIVIVEAMAAGVPVIASRVGAIPEIIDSPAAGCIVNDVEGAAFAEAIERVIALPDRGRTIGARGRASLVGRFDHATLAAELHRIYAGLR